MKVGYSGDQAEATAFVGRVPAVRASPSKSKRVLAVVGVAAVVGGALVAYHTVKSARSLTLNAAEPLTLAASQQSMMSPDDVLMTGTPFQLRTPTKGLCLDDGGGWSTGETRFILAPCDARSSNQIFTYDWTTNQIRSRDKNLCVDDGGGFSNGETKFRLWDCNPTSVDQKFEYGSDILMFYSQAKQGMCLDDGGGTWAGQTQFHLWECDTSDPNQKFEITPVVAYGVPDCLHSGHEIVLFVADKPGLCVDDGGGLFNGQTKFTNNNCNGRSPDQVFVYDANTYQFRSAHKPAMCLDDGGGTVVGQTQFHLWQCDSTNVNQRFIYQEATQQIRNPEKDLCLDDGGGVLAKQSLYTLQPCDGSSHNQRFSIMLQTEAAEIAHGQIVPVMGTVDNPWLGSGGKFIMRAIDKPGMCVDDGGGIMPGQTQFHLWDCSMDSINQVFRYDPATFMIHSGSKADLCMDDGGGTSNGETKFRLWPCDASSPDQKFVYDSATLMFRNPTKPGLCMDDGGGTSNGQTKFHLWDCVQTSSNQRFTVEPWMPAMPVGIPMPGMPGWPGMPGMPGMPAMPAYSVPDYLRTQQEVVIFAADKPGICVDDGGGWSSGQTKFVDAKCNGASQNQVFVYDPVSYMFRSARKPGMCLDDGGSGWTGHTQFHLWQCDLTNRNQRFIYEEATQHIRNPEKDWCMDDTNGVYTMQACDSSNSNQRFSILWQSEVGGSIETPVEYLTWWPAGHPLLTTNEEFMLRVPGKDNLCVDDGGSGYAGQTQFQLWHCNPSNLDQVFRYDVSSNLIRSAAKGNLCVDDGGGRSNGETKFILAECSKSDGNQKFVYDWTSQSFRNPTKPNMCMDDGGGTMAGQTKFHLWDCDMFSPNQHFEIIPRTVFGVKVQPIMMPGMPMPPPINGDNSLLLSGGKFLLRQVNKGNLCVDDGGGNVAGETRFLLQPCDPLSPNQQFMYDAMHGMAIRSANKDGLCVDDGGGHSNGETKFRLWPCDPASDDQKFVYDPATLMFQNPMKNNLCMDDGGGPTAGSTLFHLWDCSPSNFNQKFEIMGLDALDVAPPNGYVMPPPPPPMADTWPVNHPILLSGEAFMMAVPGKANLCVDDGGARYSGETKFHLWACDPANVNQAFRYDASTNTIRSALKGDLCLDDGGAYSAGETKFHLWQCDASNMNQKFVYDWSTESFKNPLKPGLCMDDGGGETAAETQFHLWKCDAGSRNQHFQILAMPTFEMIAADAIAPTLPEEGTSMPDNLVAPGSTGMPPMDLTPMEPMMPMSIDEPAVDDVADVDGMATDPEVSVLEPAAEPRKTTDPAHPYAMYENSEFDDGDWNLLAPSQDTVGPVNVDNSKEITANEIYAYLMGIKDTEDKHHAKMMFRYRRTFKCVTDGLQSMSKAAVTPMEYHSLVAWMYRHCAFDGRTATPSTMEPGMPSPTEDRVYMTKLEFYQQIKDHFSNDRESLFGQAESARLRAGTASVDHKKLMACIEEASTRFGRENEYEQLEHFHNAIQWVQTECMNAGSP